MADVEELYVVLNGKVGGFMSSMKRAEASSASFDKSIAGTAATVAKFGLGATVAVVAVGLEAAKMASTFQSSMELLRTQAGASQGEVNRLSKAVLDLAPKVGFGPDKLAESLYHIESVGLRGAKAMDVLKLAAEGAAVGHSDLEATTNALTAAVASGMRGTEDYAAAMGKLNAIVGAGDMRMQDLNNAMSTGILVTMKQYGVSLNEVGAALATFGDNNIRGQLAATELRMAVQALSSPAKAGAGALASIGLKAQNLRDDLQKGGLNLALTDLHQHLVKAGKAGTQAGQLLTDAFGKKAGVGLQVLNGQIDRFHTKLQIVGATDAKAFNQAWTDTQNTFAQKMNDLKAAVSSIAIELGTKLLPILGTLADAASKYLPIVVQKFSDMVSGIKTEGSHLVDIFSTAISTGNWSKVQEAISNAIGNVMKGAKFLNDTLENLVKSIDWEKYGMEAGAQAPKFLTALSLGFLSHLTDFIGVMARHWKETLGAIFLIGTDGVGGFLEKAFTKIPFVGKFFGPILKTLRGFASPVVDAIQFVIKKLGGAFLDGLELVMPKMLGRLLKEGELIGTRIGVWALNIAEAMGRLADKWATAAGKAVGFTFRQMGMALADAARGFASSVGNLLVDAGKLLIRGLVKGIEASFSAVKDTLGSLTNKLTSWKGPPEKDKVLLHGSGVLVMKGFQNGLESQYTLIRDSLGRFTVALPEPVAAHQRAHRGGHARQHGPIRDVYGTYVTADAKYLAQVQRHNHAVALSHEHMQQRILRAHEAAVKAALILSKRHARALIEDAQEAGRKMLEAAKTALAGQRDAIKSMMSDLDGLKKERDSFAAGIASGITSGFGDILGIFTELTRGSTEAKKALDATAAAATKAAERYADLQAQAASYTHITVAQQQNLTDAATAVTAATDAATAAQVAYNTATAAAGDPVKQLTQTLTEQLAKTKKFSTDLQTLTAQGAGKDLIEKLAKAGADSGDALASALLAAGPGAVKNINDLMAGIADAGKTAGDAIAGQYYQQGIDSMQHLIDGMQLKEKALQDEVNRVNAILASLGAAKEAVNQATNTKGVNTAVGSVGLGKPSGHAPVVVHKGAVTVHVTSPQVTPAHVTAAVNTGMRQLATMIQSGRAR